MPTGEVAQKNPLIMQIMADVLGRKSGFLP